MKRAAALALALLAGAPALTASAETLRVFAAASLSEALREIAAAFEKAHPGDTVELNLAGSQVLRTQIEQGAPADVFASADLGHAAALKAAGLTGPYQVFARNRIAVVLPMADAKVAGIADLARPGVKVVLAAPTVPAGRYALQVIAKLAASGRYGPEFLARVQGNVASQETNVRAVLAKVALGEADAGFVYVTDVVPAAGKVRVLEIPEAENVVAEYAIGVVAKSAAPQSAKAFVELVLGGDGQAILRKYGFVR